jgi:hypothetical protein
VNGGGDIRPPTRKNQDRCANSQLMAVNAPTDPPPILDPATPRAKDNSMWRRTMCIAVAILAGWPAVALAGRYELVTEPDVRRVSSHSVASAYVIDKEANQFWICTARYHYQDLTANNGDCVKLSTDIGRPSLTDSYEVRAVAGSAMIGSLLPVFWFIEPTSGDVQFCAIRHAGLCVRMSLP